MGKIYGMIKMIQEFNVNLKQNIFVTSTSFT